MRLTAFADYELRSLMRLAGEPTRVFTTGEMAREFAISRNNLTKAIRNLTDAGFVRTQRGANGGFNPARRQETAANVKGLAMMISIDHVAEAVLRTVSDAIIAADKDGIIRFWSPGAERIFGHTSGDAIGQSLDIIIPERQRARHWLGYRHVMATGESRYSRGDILAVPSIRKDGGRISIEFTIVPLRDAAGQMIGMAVIMRDVTVRFEEMRALRQKLAETNKRGE